MASVIAFPTEKTCFTCTHLAMTGTGSSYCLVFGETILNERLAAEDCEAYDRE